MFMILAIVFAVLLTVAPIWIVSELKEVRKRLQTLIELEILSQKARLEK